MSKAFTKEDDGEEAAIIPPRAPLPAGVPNYMTARGMAQLREEWSRLDQERAQLARDADHTRRLAFLQGRIADLAARIGSAQLVEAPAEAPTQVRFGTTVTVRAAATDELRRFTVVGVDEADAATGLVAFVSPIARALLGRMAGEVVTVPAASGRDDDEWVIETIERE
jgi:transcription elongation factor GreB